MVKVGLEVRYVCRDERAFSRVGRSVRVNFSGVFLLSVAQLYSASRDSCISALLCLAQETP